MSVWDGSMKLWAKRLSSKLSSRPLHQADSKQKAARVSPRLMPLNIVHFVLPSFVSTPEANLFHSSRFHAASSLGSADISDYLLYAWKFCALRCLLIIKSGKIYSAWRKFFGISQMSQESSASHGCGWCQMERLWSSLIVTIVFQRPPPTFPSNEKCMNGCALSRARGGRSDGALNWSRVSHFPCALGLCLRNFWNSNRTMFHISSTLCLLSIREC